MQTQYYCDRVHIYSTSGARYLESGTVASFSCTIKKHVSCNLAIGYSLYLVYATWPKKGGSSEPPRTPPPLCTGLSTPHTTTLHHCTPNHSLPLLQVSLIAHAISLAMSVNLQMLSCNFCIHLGKENLQKMLNP